jgi:hypothetical protein
MIAPRTLPDAYVEWNKRHHAPSGRPGRRYAYRLGRNRLSAIYIGPYGWQLNSSTRTFEYPWVYEQISSIGRPLAIADVGASHAGMQFTLAAAGHGVHAVDPGLNAHGTGWSLDPAFHALLQRTYRAPVELHPCGLEDAAIGDGSLDILLSISAIEHFSDEDLDAFITAGRSLLRRDGQVVLTIDLFLDLAPFTSRKRNPLGTNVDVRAIVDGLGADLLTGEPSELLGYPEFDADRIQSNLSQYFVGSGMYPTLVQCLVACV